MIDGEVDAMKKMGEILAPFDQEVQIRMLKFIVARSMGWSGCRFQRTLFHMQEIGTEEYA